MIRILTIESVTKAGIERVRMVVNPPLGVDPMTYAGVTERDIITHEVLLDGTWDASPDMVVFSNK